MKLHQLAHARTGDKGDTLTLSLFAYRADDLPLLDAFGCDDARQQGQVAGTIGK